jgi:2-C-methyl-D-erythritol 4-phosphate cytidylyltransferase
MKPVVAVVPAAGKGKRFGREKTFISLKGEPLLYWSLLALQNVDEVVEIIPVVDEAWLEKTRELVEDKGFTKVKKIAPGGAERQESVYNGLKLIEKQDCLVLIHDGARPLVSVELIKRVIYALDREVDGVVPAVAVKDTIKEVKDRIVLRTLRREDLRSIQTPQVFFYNTLINAYGKYSEEFFTDDATVVEKNGGRIKTVPGDYRNIKITTAEDLIIAEALLNMVIMNKGDEI